MNDTDEIKCPVCREHTDEEADQAVGVVLSGAKAVLTGDVSVVSDVTKVLTTYDGHIAITLYASLLAETANAFRMDPLEVLDDLRAQHNAKKQA